MNSPEGIFGSRFDIFRSDNFDAALFHSQVKLVIFETPAPITVTQTVQLLEIFGRQH